jgi:hypothetical protein
VVTTVGAVGAVGAAGDAPVVPPLSWAEAAGTGSMALGELEPEREDTGAEEFEQEATTT